MPRGLFPQTELGWLTMSFAAIVVTTLGVVVVALIALGLWHRRRPSDIWEEDVVRSSTKRSRIEQGDVEEIFETHPRGWERERGDAEEEAGPPAAERRAADE